MDWVKERLQKFSTQAIAVNDSGSITYADFLAKIEGWHKAIQCWGIKAGDRVGLIADYHIEMVALLQALLECACIIIPLSEDDRHVFAERLDIACANKVISIADPQLLTSDNVQCRDYQGQPKPINPLLIPMLREARAGVVIYTSGSTGKSKAVLLDYQRMIKKYKSKIGKPLRTLLFLKLDHIGGLNTLFSVIFNGGTIVTSPSRQARDICQCIVRYSVELLPTTPSFLNMLLMSGICQRYEFPSLKIITYGTEVMPNSTLAGIHRALPGVELKQTYGLSELGILPSQSQNSQSKWMKLGGAGFDIKVKDQVLWIKSEQAMLGYLNADSPFDEQGWYNTGDRVEVDGDYFRILGRESEIINVAGEKVFPIEIESYLLTLDNVKEVVVRGKRSPIVGQIVWAEFVLQREESLLSFQQRIVVACQSQFPPFKVPGLITITSYDRVMGSRFKKIRQLQPARGIEQLSQS